MNVSCITNKIFVIQCTLAQHFLKTNKYTPDSVSKVPNNTGLKFFKKAQKGNTFLGNISSKSLKKPQKIYMEDNTDADKTKVKLI